MSLATTNTFGPLTTDLYRHAGGFPSLPLMIHGCPQCGYSGHAGAFDPDEVTPRLKEWVRANLKPVSGRFRAGAKYENSARIVEHEGAPPYQVANIWLRAGWCEDGQSESGVRYRREAVLRFEAAMDAGQVPKGERAIITYLIGELHRRIGDAAKAKDWFARVPNAVAGNAKEQWLIDLAIQQSTNPQEFVEEKRGR
jgi:hypothetical protein